jgi:hypothetical protein
MGRTHFQTSGVQVTGAKYCDYCYKPRATTVEKGWRICAGCKAFKSPFVLFRIIVLIAFLYIKTKGKRMLSFLKDLGNKAVHALVPALGAAAMLFVSGGSFAPIVLAKAAVGAAIGYLVKPARTDTKA